MNYGIKLKSLREEKNMKLYDIASILGINADTYGLYEREYTIIPIKHLNTLANYFNVSIDYLFELNNTINYKENKKDINEKLSGERLKALRKENKLTQEKLSVILNTDRTTISKYEKGINTIATPFLYEICNKYHVSADYLIGKIDINYIN